MEINCFYDEDMEYADIIYIPNTILDIKELQNNFFRWLFDKNNDHQYWIIVNGEKKMCRYGTQAFIDWINNVILLKHYDKSYIIKENSKSWNSKNMSLIF